MGGITFLPSGEQLHLSGKEAQFASVNNALIPLWKKEASVRPWEEKWVLGRMTAKPEPNHQLTLKGRHWFASAERNVTSPEPLFSK